MLFLLTPIPENTSYRQDRAPQGIYISTCAMTLITQQINHPWHDESFEVVIGTRVSRKGLGIGPVLFGKPRELAATAGFLLTHLWDKSAVKELGRGDIMTVTITSAA